jgi:DNA-binding MarR family transcriptional regulator
MLRRDAQRLIALYPRVFFACHTRHVRDPRTKRLVTEHQAQILDHLDPRRPLTLAGLARHMGVKPATMSLNVERLVRGGYVVRERDPADARRVQLRLSPAGRRVKESHQVLDRGRVRTLLKQLLPAERQRALDGLALLARAAEEIMHTKSLYGGLYSEREMAG